MKRLSIIIILLLLHIPIECKAYMYNDININTDKINSYINDETNIGTSFDTIAALIADGELSKIPKEVAVSLKECFNRQKDYHKKIMLILIAVVILSVMINVICINEFSQAANTAVICVCALVLTQFYKELYDIAYQTIEDILALMKLSLPLFLGTSAAILHRVPAKESVFIGFISLFQWLCQTVLLPTISVAFCMCVLNGAGNGINLTKLKSTLVTAVNWITGIASTLFISALKITQIASYSTDKLAYSGIKYTISHGIPVVGGYVSDALGAVINAAAVIHNSIGTAAAIFIFLISAVPIVYIFLCSLALKFIGSLSEAFSSTPSSLIYDVGVCIGELAVILLITVISFIISISLMISVVMKI